ncbi:MAG: beta-lactamase family protein [Deltaproteobacteria bacterium]|nr:beta-lactamase family protein [Deltaproteobacteria bacterium]
MNKYFDYVPEDKARITIHHLLTHTAGLLHSYGEDYETAFRDEALKKMFDRALEFQPGTAYSYSNGGYSVLAALVERVTGKSFEEYLRSAFFDPLGMKYTGYTVPEQLELPVVIDKSRKAGPYWYLYGNGGLLSTTGDLFRWHLALHADEVLSKPQLKKLFTPHVKTNEGTSFYGYGWFIDKTPRGTTLICHSGESGEGINSDFRYYRDENILIIIFSDVRLNGKVAVDVAKEMLEKAIFG